MKRFLKITLWIVIPLVVLLAVAWFFIDSIAKTAVEQKTTDALGVTTTVEAVKINPLQGAVRIDGLTIRNPEGFKTPHFIKTGRFDLGVRLGSLLEDTIEVNRFDLDGLDMHLEQKPGSSNTSVILNHIKKSGGGHSASLMAGKGGPKQAEPAGESSGKKVKVNRIVIRHVVAHVQVLPVGGKAATLDVKVPEIVLNDVTSDNAAGVAVGELVRRLVPAILAAVVEKGKGIIPEADLDRLGADLADAAAALGDAVGQLIRQSGGDVGKLGKDLKASLKKTEKALHKDTESLRDLFDEKKKEGGAEPPN